MTPLLAFTAAWVAGILLAQAAFFHPLWFLLVLPALLSVHFGWRHAPHGRWLCIALIGLLLGAGRFQLGRAVIDAGHIAQYNGAEALTVTGVVVAEPDPRTYCTNLRVAAEAVTLADGARYPVHGDLLVRAPVYADVHYGDRIAATGALETPPVFDTFSYREYLARQGLHARLRCTDVWVLAEHQGAWWRDALLRFKEYALARLLRILPEPQASLAAGILLGVESGIPAALNEAFVATGTSHIVAISGFNLTIVAGIFSTLARRLGKGKGHVLIAIGAIWVYTLLVGASAAVVRAAVMGTLGIWARQAGRRQHGPTSLALAALVMSAHDPQVLWDVGFQLSLAATAGLIFFTDPLTTGCMRFLARFMSVGRAEKIVGCMSEALLVTVAAQITTTPIIVAKFHRLSLITLVTNFLILPVQTFVMVFGGIALIAALIWLPLGQLLGWVAWVFLTYTIEVVRWTATFPWASVPIGRVGLPLVWGYYLALALGWWWFSSSKAVRQQWLQALGRVPAGKLAFAAAIPVLLGAYLYTLPDGQLHVVFLDVGQGDAIFIQTPSGRQVVIDGGPDAPALLSAVGRQMPFWDRTLDLVIVTSPDDERLAGLVPLLERYRVAQVATGSEVGSGAIYERWRELLAQREPASVGELAAGSEWPLDAGVSLQVLWPAAEGQSGPLVLQLRYAETTVLLAGDVTTVVEEALVARYGDTLAADVLHVPRHGAKTAATPALLQAVQPEIAVIAVGAGNFGDDPAPQVLARLIDQVVYRTDQHGSIDVISDGAELQVRVARSSTTE